MQEPRVSKHELDQLLAVARRDLKRQRFQEVIDSTQAVLGLDPELAEAYLLSSLAHVQLGKIVEAEERLQQLLAHNESSAEAHGLLGAIRVSRAEYARAIQALNRSISLNPRPWRPHFNLGIALARSGRQAEALLEYWIAFRNHPSWRTLREPLIEILLARPAAAFSILAGLLLLPLAVRGVGPLAFSLTVALLLGALAFSSDHPRRSWKLWAFLALLGVIVAVDVLVASYRW